MSTPNDWESVTERVAEIATKFGEKLQEVIEGAIINPKAKWRIYPGGKTIEAYLESYGDVPIRFNWGQFYDGIEGATTQEEMFDTIGAMLRVISRLEIRNGMTFEEFQELKRKGTTK